MRTRATVPAGVWTSPYGRSDIRPPSRLEIKNTYAEGLRRLLRWWVQFGARSCEGAAPAMPVVADKVGGDGGVTVPPEPAPLPVQVEVGARRAGGGTRRTPAESRTPRARRCPRSTTGHPGPHGTVRRLGRPAPTWR